MLVQLDSNTTPSPEEPDHSPAPPPATFRVEAWLDPLIDEVGHDPRSAYVETFWHPVLGPPNMTF
jgi:hypothetical protein